LIFTGSNLKEVLFNLHDVVLLITVYQCVLFAVFMVTLKKGKKQSNILLALFLLSYAAIPLDTLINFGEAFRDWAIQFSPNIFYVFGTAYWLEAVFLLFYVRSMIYRDYRLSRTDWLYFLPFIAYVIWEILVYYSLDYTTKVEVLQGYNVLKSPDYTRMLVLVRESFRMYCGVLCMIELARYQTQIRNELSNIEKVDLTWLKILVIGFLVIRADAILVSVALISSAQFNFYIDYEFFGLASNYTVMFLISTLIFFSLAHSPLFNGIAFTEDDKSIDKKPVDEELVLRIESYMDSNKPYLNCVLNLAQLATELSMPPRTLSNIINRHFSQNFFEFINSYRVKESQRLLAQPEKQTESMLEIMEQAGFNSKATFNTFFKKKVGMTPSQYKTRIAK